MQRKTNESSPHLENPSLERYIVSVPDFPQPGVLFRDISQLLKQAFNEAVDSLSTLLSPNEWQKIEHIAGIESRGFVFASALAYKHHKGLIILRKAGKLPHVAGQVSYDLEYGTATLETQAGSGTILIVDDILATGGTLAAAAKLCTKVGYNVYKCLVFMHLAYLQRDEISYPPTHAVITYDE